MLALICGPVFAEPQVERLYHANGRLAAEGPFEDGLREGYFKEYTEEGVLRVEGAYARGIKEGPFKEYDAVGRLVWERDYKDGQLHGFARKWHSNGNLATEWHFVNGQPDGLAKEFYNTGEQLPRRQWNFSKAACDGTVLVNEYDAQGQVTHSKSYLDNSLVQRGAVAVAKGCAVNRSSN